MVSCFAEHKKVKKGSDHMDSTAHINTDLVSFGYSESTYVMTDYALHCHNFYEVFYFLSGDADYLVEVLKPEIVIKAASAHHPLRGRGRCKLSADTWKCAVTLTARISRCAC